MKKQAQNIVLKVLVLILPISLIGQVAIGKTTIDGDGLLDFQTGTTSGIILPRVTTLNGTAGTLAYDTADNKVKYNNGSWIDLSIVSGTVDITEQNTFTDSGSETTIGTSSSQSGVLVLESSDKALILPKIASPEINVKTPEAGMICYDTVKKNLAIYNGQQWTFWSTN